MGTGFRIHVCMLPPSKNSILTDAVFTWRREWDSNPRGARTPNGFQDRLVMTTSISLQDVLSCFVVTTHIYYHKKNCMSIIKTNFFEENLKLLLHFQKICVIISLVGSTERWLSWSKAHDWKSCVG